MCFSFISFVNTNGPKFLNCAGVISLRCDEENWGYYEDFKGEDVEGQANPD